MAPLKGHEAGQKYRESQHAEIGRTSQRTRVVVEDEVLVKEAESVMAREGIHHELAHEHWTGPWEGTEVVLPGISYIVTNIRGGIRRRRASATSIKMFHSRPDILGHDFENEFAHLAWGVDFGLAEPLIILSLMYPLKYRNVDGSGQRLEVAIQGTIRG